MKRLGVFLISLFLVACCAASRMCLHDTSTLPLVDTSRENSFCTHEGGCLIEWSVELDTTKLDPLEETAQRPRWPISIRVGIQKTPLNTIYPELNDVDVMCSPTGDIIMTTATTANNERMRFIWSYDTTGFYTCMDLFSHLDLTSGFRNFQALFAFDGSISFNAAYSSRDSFHSLYHQQVECPSSTQPVQPHGGQPMNPSPSPAPVSEINHVCAIECTHDSTFWSKHKDTATYLALSVEKICGVSKDDIFERKGDYIKLPSNIASQARRVFIQELTVTSFGCNYPQGEQEFVAFESLRRYLADSVNCGSDVYHQAWMDTLLDYEQGRLGTPSCKESGGGVDGLDIGKASNHTLSSCENTKDIYLWWAIAATVLAVVLLIAFAFALVFLLAYVCADPRIGGGRRGAFAKSIRAALQDESDDEDDVQDDEEEVKAVQRRTKRVEAGRAEK